MNTGANGTQRVWRQSRQSGIEYRGVGRCGRGLPHRAPSQWSLIDRPSDIMSTWWGGVVWPPSGVSMTGQRWKRRPVINPQLDRSTERTQWAIHRGTASLSSVGYKERTAAQFGGKAHRCAQVYASTHTPVTRCAGRMWPHPGSCYRLSRVRQNAAYSPRIDADRINADKKFADLSLARPRGEVGLRCHSGVVLLRRTRKQMNCTRVQMYSNNSVSTKKKGEILPAL